MRNDNENTTVIHVPNDDGFVQFECRQVGTLDLAERLKRQENLWATGRAAAGHHEDRLHKALIAGNGVLAAAVLSEYPDRTALDVGDDALDFVAGLFDDYRDAQAMRYDPESPDGFIVLQGFGPAAVIGEVAFIKEADRILVLHITDAQVLGSRTWTPTAEESAYLDDETSTAAGRIGLAHMCREHGDIRGAAYVGAWHNRYDAGADIVSALPPGFTAINAQQLRFPGGMIQDDLFELMEMLTAGDEDDGDIPYDDPVRTEARNEALSRCYGRKTIQAHMSEEDIEYVDMYDGPVVLGNAEDDETEFLLRGENGKRLMRSIEQLNAPIDRRTHPVRPSPWSVASTRADD